MEWGCPSRHHPFRTMGFSRSQKPSSYGGTPMTMEIHHIYLVVHPHDPQDNPIYNPYI